MRIECNKGIVFVEDIRQMTEFKLNCLLDSLCIHVFQSMRRPSRRDLTMKLTIQ